MRLINSTIAWYSSPNQPESIQSRLTTDRAAASGPDPDRDGPATALSTSPQRTDIEPGAYEVTNVFAQVLIADADTGGAHDESAGWNVFFGADRLDQLPQTMALVV